MPAARRRVQCESAIIIGNDGFVLCKLEERDDHGKSGFALGHRPRATHDVRKCIGGNANNNWPAAIHERHSRPVCSVIATPSHFQPACTSYEKRSVILTLPPTSRGEINGENTLPAAHFALGLFSSV